MGAVREWFAGELAVALNSHSRVKHQSLLRPRWTVTLNRKWRDVVVPLTQGVTVYVELPGGQTYTVAVLQGPGDTYREYRMDPKVPYAVGAEFVEVWNG